MLVYTKLQNDFFNIFNAMDKIYKNGDFYMAEKCAKAIADYVYSGEVSTIDSSTVYTGKGSGKMKINATLLKNAFVSTFSSKRSNRDFAIRIANDINTICTMTNTVETDSKGVIAPYGNFAEGKGYGKFSPTSNNIAIKLQNCFNSMNSMKKNGNLYFAQEFAKVIDEYLKNGIISVTIPTLSASGEGKIS